MSWGLATWFVVGLAALFAVLAVANAALTMAAPDPAPPSSSGVVAGLVAVGLLLLLTTIGLVIALVVWTRATRRVVEAHGADSRRYVRHWGVRFWSVCLVLTFFLQIRLGTTDRVLLAGAALRTIGAICLAAAILVARGRVMQLILTPAGPPVAAQRYSLVDGGLPDSRLPLPATPEPGDWNASVWDPTIQADIERRRRRAIRSGGDD